MVFHGQADPEHFDVARGDPARYGFAQVFADIGLVAAQRIPDEFVPAEGVEVDPAALDSKSDRFRDCVVQPEQRLVAEQGVGEFGLGAAGASGKIPADLIHIGQTGPGGYGVYIGVPRPYAGVVQIGITHSYAKPQVGGVAAAIGKVEV